MGYFGGVFGSVGHLSGIVTYDEFTAESKAVGFEQGDKAYGFGLHA